MQTQYVIYAVETECWGIPYVNVTLPQLLTDVLTLQTYEYLLQHSVCTILANNAVPSSNALRLTEYTLPYM